MLNFSSPRLRRQVLSIGDAYGGPRFWYELLREDCNPDNVWRALLYIGCLGAPGPEPAIRNKLLHPDTRVRAMACFAAGQYRDEAAADQLLQLCADGSPRVRIHARAALAAIVKPGAIPALPGDASHTEFATILISEDSLRSQDALTEALGAFGPRIACAAETAETMEMARRLRPIMVVTDNQKGRDNTAGLRVAEEISRDAQLRETTLLMSSADPLDGVFLWHGGDYFVHKLIGGLTWLRTVVAAYLQQTHPVTED